MHRLRLSDDRIVSSVPRSRDAPLSATIQWGVGEVRSLPDGDLLLVEKSPFRLSRVLPTGAVARRSKELFGPMTRPHEAFEVSRTSDGRRRERLRSNIRTPLRSYVVDDSSLVVGIRNDAEVLYVEYSTDGAERWRQRVETSARWLAAIDARRRRVWMVERDEDTGRSRVGWVRYSARNESAGAAGIHFRSSGSSVSRSIRAEVFK